MSTPDRRGLLDPSHESLSVHRQCALVGVARSGFYRAKSPAGNADLVREATQIVLTDRTALTRGQDFAVSSAKAWRIGDLGAKHALLRAGVGWGNMPEHMVDGDLEAGRLVRLELREGRSHDYPLSLLQRSDTLLGPAATWLTERLAGADVAVRAASA